MLLYYRKKECTMDINPIKILMALRSIVTCYHNSLYRVLFRLSMVSSEEPARKKPATEYSIHIPLCLLCQRDKFTNIKCDHQVEQLRQPALEWTVYKIGPNIETLSTFACIKKTEWRIWRRTENCTYSVVPITSWQSNTHTTH